MNKHDLYRSATLRHIESRHADLPLMQRAGAAAAAWGGELVRTGRPVLILAGPGNNGGDAFEAARRLSRQSHEVSLAFRGDPALLPRDAAAAFTRFMAEGGRYCDQIPEIHGPWGLIIDGLFGIGLTRAPTGHYADWIERANMLARRDDCPLLALDCPSGLDADTGHVPGAVIHASHTLSFIATKPGLLTGDGPDCCGVLAIADLDLPASDDIPPDGRQLDLVDFSAWLQARRRNTHKGSFGSAGIIGGAASMLGAALLAGRAALKLGTGRVYLGLIDHQGATVDAQQPELMLRSAENLPVAALQALACGPGLGQSTAAREALLLALAAPCPVVLDADALNLIAGDNALAEMLKARPAPTLLTPHPAEAARLLDCSIAEVQRDRIAAAQALTARYRAGVVLKGCGSIISTVEGLVFINTTGNPGMATAGMGDVLTGLVVALLAQGWPPEPALLAAVHLHGAAADDCVANGQGPIGLTASEVIEASRTRFNRWITRRP